MRVWPKNRSILATHSDSKKVFVWDMNSQNSVKEKVKLPASTPDLILEGHEDTADYALAWSSVAPILASGGKDKKILLWNIETFLQQKGIVEPDPTSLNEQQLQMEDEASEVSVLAQDEAILQEKEEVKIDTIIEEANINELTSQLSFTDQVRRRDVKQDRKNKHDMLQPRQVKEIGDYLAPAKTVKKNLMPFAKLIGHTNSVEDVVFKPDS